MLSVVMLIVVSPNRHIILTQDFVLKLSITVNPMQRNNTLRDRLTR